MICEKSNIREINGKTEKFCKHCNTWKEINLFKKKHKKEKIYIAGMCSKCDYQKYKESYTKHNQEYREAHTEELKEYGREYYKDNKEELLQKAKEYWMENKDHLGIKRKECYQKNRDTILEKASQYAKENREKINTYAKNRKENDINFKLTCILRSRLFDALKGRTKKTQKALELLGCTIEEFKLYIESLWLPGMSWDNHGSWKRGEPMKWHIDHITPCCRFDMTKELEQKECFNWKNLQPLWADKNLSKQK